jgi:hypothetical protein
MAAQTLPGGTFTMAEDLTLTLRERGPIYQPERRHDV